ncbi:hypothetical protein FRX31_004964 [Thalictrum thalictroides]|uniref:adenine phosphoribosyltransferase n=1 Tax=Thalictrum thalictroides TaxID=46969 RepID=A0A7J6X757_THATH|nr:hypothetical protein FRX31_004964 [Thalictrum thalictroides]
MHVGAVQSGERAVVVDDLVCTGGKYSASIKLLERIGAEYKKYEQGCGTLLVTGEKLAYCRGYHFVMFMLSSAIEFAVFGGENVRID